MVVNCNGEGHWSSPRNSSINRNINSYVIIRVTMNYGINFIQLRNIYFLKIFIVIFICEVMCECWHFTHIWKHSHDLLISLQTEICAHETSLAPPRYIEVRKVSGHVYMFMGIAFDSLNYFFYWNLVLFRRNST
jgi:hypothetical protein